MYKVLMNGLLGDYIFILMQKDGDVASMLLCAVLLLMPAGIIYFAFYSAENKSIVLSICALVIAVFGADILLSHLLITVPLYFFVGRDKR